MEFASTRQHGKRVACVSVLNICIKTCFITSMWTVLEYFSYINITEGGVVMQHHFGNVVPTASSFLLNLLMDVLPK